MPDLATFLTWTTLGVHVVVVYLLFCRSFIRTYPWFSLLVLYLAATALVNMGVLYWFGYLSPVYYYSVYGCRAAQPVLRTVALWSILRKFRPETDIQRSDLYFCVLLAALVCVPLYRAILTFRGADWLAIYQALITPLELVHFVFVVRLILQVRGRYVLGRNVAGILTGVGLLIIGETVNAERAYVSQSFELFVFLGQFSEFLAFGTWALDFWEPDPPRLRQKV